MKILRRLLTKKQVKKKQGKAKFEKIGNVEAICPYCQNELEKKPGRKKKCPHCGNFIYVRTRPADRERVLVTETQSELIEKQWRIYHNEPELTPAGRDAQWALFNKELLEHAKRGDWGLYRSTRYNMGEFLHKEGKTNQALVTFLEVCYIDLNGPNNMGGRKTYPPFDTELGFLAPGIINGIKSFSEELEIGIDDVHSEFEKIAGRLYKNLKLPVAPKAAWKEIEANLIYERPKTGYDYAYAASEAWDKGDAQEAQQWAQQAIPTEISPNTKAKVYRVLGEIAESQDKPQDAIRHYEQAIELNPKVGVKRQLNILRQQYG